MRGRRRGGRGRANARRSHNQSSREEVDEVVGFVEEIELSAQGIDVGAAIIRQNSGAMTTVELAR